MLPDERVQNLCALAFFNVVAAEPAGRATDTHLGDRELCEGATQPLTDWEQMLRNLHML
jgi:hypothetical protein